MNEHRFYHLPLSWGQALFYDGGLRPLREVTVGVYVNNQGAPRVVMLEIATVLADSFVVQSSCCLTYADFITTTRGYAVHLAEGSVVL